MNHRPVPLQDLAEEYATPSKPASAWLQEFKRARASGDLKILKRGGNENGNNYSTRHLVGQYIRKTYCAEASNAAC
ncbi:MAG TPA: hypothetical protein EYO33_03410 [Phycisphaerales bacterium]|nr:hypothetical protein [Phycisphaerales bacterium]